MNSFIMSEHVCCSFSWKDFIRFSMFITGGVGGTRPNGLWQKPWKIDVFVLVIAGVAFKIIFLFGDLFTLLTCRNQHSSSVPSSLSHSFLRNLLHITLVLLLDMNHQKGLFWEFNTALETDRVSFFNQFVWISTLGVSAVAILKISAWFVWLVNLSYMCSEILPGYKVFITNVTILGRYASDLTRCVTWWVH